MLKFCFMALIALTLTLAFGAGCKHPGSREFKPGKGWVPN